LNLSCKTIDPWTFDKAVQQILNKNASTLWNEYVSVINKGSKPVVKFNADRTLIGVGQSVNFTNSSQDALCYDWTFEGGSPRKSYDQNPTIRYNKEGVYKVTLVAHNKNAIGPGIEVKRKYITVGNSTGTNDLSASLNKIKVGPNPFEERTNIEFNLQQPGSVSLVIYNQLGQQVKQIVNQNLDSGWHQYSWLAENDNGTKMATGQYIYVLRTNDYSFTGKLILLK
jgi:plastocyanin